MKITLPPVPTDSTGKSTNHYSDLGKWKDICMDIIEACGPEDGVELPGMPDAALMGKNAYWASSKWKDVCNAVIKKLKESK